MNKSLMLVAVASLAMTACATHSQGVQYGQMQQPVAQQPAVQPCKGQVLPARVMRSSSPMWPGVIESIHYSTLEQENSSVAPVTGAILGGATGAALGNKFGGGNGKKLFTLFGGVLGAGTGAAIGNNYAKSSAQAPAVTLFVNARWDDGVWRTRGYPQPANECERFVVGQPVYVVQMQGEYYVMPR